MQMSAFHCSLSIPYVNECVLIIDLSDQSIVMTSNVTLVVPPLLTPIDILTIDARQLAPVSYLRIVLFTSPLISPDSQVKPIISIHPYTFLIAFYEPFTTVTCSFTTTACSDANFCVSPRLLTAGPCVRVNLDAMVTIETFSSTQRVMSASFGPFYAIVTYHACITTCAIAIAGTTVESLSPYPPRSNASVASQICIRPRGA